MKNKLVIIGVISIFLLNGITTTAINIENNDDSFESKEPKYHDENINDIFYKEVDNSKKINCYTNKDGVDLTFKKNYVWWSPAPMYDDAEFFCYQYFIYNLGNAYNITIHFDVKFTFFYPDGSNESQVYTCGDFKLREGPIIGVRCYRRFYEERPNEVKLSLICNLPIEDINPENNAVITEVLPGITIHGKVYDKNLFRNKTQVQEIKVIIQCDNDVEGYDEWGVAHYKDYGYVLCIPKDPKKGPYQYSMEIIYLDLRNQYYKTEPMDQYDHLEKDFVFIKMKSNRISNLFISRLQSSLCNNIGLNLFS